MTRIGQLMSRDLATIRPTATVEEASILMTKMRIRHLPVVDSGGHLVGMLSDRDLRGPMVTGATPSVPSPSFEVGHLMARDLVVARADEDLGTVARRIVDRRISAVPIVDVGGRLVGIVSYVDVLRRLADEADAEARALELMDAM